MSRPDHLMDGVARCEEAFERLKTGKPVVAAHVDIDRSKITAGIVSVEAGFDRGYLKKARPSHAPLIALIESYRKGMTSTSITSQTQIRRAKQKIEQTSSELEAVKFHLFRVLTQNIQLVERVRILEQQLKSTKVVPIRN
ncbi:hypothetical protein ACEPYM_20315 [Pseudomonas aeruginosa]|uniref:hypothetical protein n=1 Tax=Pseudomonas TaxID=286 RepID=UPI0009E856F6|nr:MULTISPECIES: hypothetical protein [Pseudomonas]MDI3815728.1 hypothetical protein [Pseudomonas aeruginosa]MDG9854924.1 hypothetical protein [Pseudomonas nitroreducens]MDI4060120.1 hypothetical protein [Pseudomonas aeruginosa]MDI4168156.1 hypothetical protein [Pseudomonas aeruginosa]UCL87882.1 hypothetical protein LDJ84_04055 [Pseudomonas sp. HS-18]